MKKIAIVYWSGTGNTENMARCVAEGVKDAGGEDTLLTPSEFSADKLPGYDAVAFGCPAMGAEELEETEFVPMFSALESSLSGKKIALFGSFGWGDGQWMRDWYDRCKTVGAVVYEEPGLMICETPDAAGQETCREFGRALAKW